MKDYILLLIMFLLLIQSKLVVSICNTDMKLGQCCDSYTSVYCVPPLGCCSGGSPYWMSDSQCSSCDTNPPTYSSDNDSSGGSATAGTIVNITVLWSDYSELSNAIFRYNLTGVWSNASTCYLSGTSGWCNQTIYTTGISGTVCWNQWANDTSNNWNNTMLPHCFNVGCGGTVALNCSVPPVAHPGFDERNLIGSCGRANAKIDCNGTYNSHTVCNTTSLCNKIEPSISKYSVSSTSINVGGSFSINVNGNCPSDLPGKCLVECRVIHPDGHYIELDAWSNSLTTTMPSVTCNQVGNYIVDYCVVATDFNANRGWNNLNDTNTTINCKPLPQCSDGIDNNGNGLIDANDPGCHSDGNSSNPASYDPNDNTECSEKLTSCSKSENCCSGLICGFGNVCRVSDSNPPTYSSDNDSSGGSATAGTIVNITVLWSDYSELSNAIFRYNLTGVWSNASTCYLSGTSGWCNQTIYTTGISGTVCWNQWANDTSNNWNNTMLPHCFNVVRASETSSSQNETPFSSIESILESLRGEISSSTSEFSMKFLNLTFQFFGILILSMLLIIVIEELVKSH